MSDGVAKRTKAAEALVERAAVGRALMGGTQRMRAEGETYLPKFEAESAKAYDARRNASWLFNAYKKAVKDMTGRVFCKSAEVSDGALDKDIEANIDGQNNDLSAFARNVFEAGLSGAGVTFIMADAPPRSGVVTVDQAASANLRPYLVHVQPDEVLGWKTEAVGSRTVLSQWRMIETVEEQDPADEFTTHEIEQIRVLTLEAGRVNVRLYRKAAKSDKWELWDEFPTDAPEITVVPFYAARTGFFMAEPPLQDLADVNVAHWQSQSDQRNILHFARVPILTAAGYDDDDGRRPLVLSAGMANTSRDADFKMAWVEHSGAAIGAGRDDLKDLEFQMQALGLQLLVAGQETATGAALDAAKETAPLAMMADNLKDALEQALSWLAMYQGRDEAFTVAVNKDFGVIPLTAQEVTAMLMAVNTGNMPRRVFVEEMKRRGFIQSDTDTEGYIDDLDAEAPDLTAPDDDE